MKRNLLLLFFFSFLFGLNAQNKVSISGTILDKKDNEPILQASVRVLKPDSTYVTGAVSNLDGKFSIQVNPGQYILHFSFLGYADVYKNVNASGSSNSVGTIYLEESSILLDEAVIIAKAVEIIVREDTVEYNADSYKVQESAVVEDLLKKMPGVELDSDGKITINGKEVKKILIDGKEFFSDDPKVASKNLPASMVNKLQVYDKKSDMARMTGFDDGEEETVINLTVKKGMKEGVFGNAFAGYGSTGRYEVNGMVNYMRNNSQFTLLGGSNNTNNAGFSDFASTMFSGNRPMRGMAFGGRNGITTSTNGGFNFATEISEKFSWGGNIRYGNTDNDVERKTSTTYYAQNPDSTQYEYKLNKGNNVGRNLGLDLRMEWKPDSATTIIFKPRLQYSKNINTQESDYLTTFADRTDSINWGNSLYHSESKGLNLNGELEISRELGKKGRVLSASISGGINNQSSEGKNYSITTFNNGIIDKRDQIFNQTNDSKNWRGYISYVEPLKNNNFLQLTYSYRNNHSEADNKTYKNDYGFTNYEILDTTATRFLKNDFVNQEIGLNFKSVRPKYNYLIGIAVQPSKSDSYDIRLDTTIVTTTNVVNFSPVAQFNYMWSQQKNLRINYSGRVDQPTARQLSAADQSDPMDIVFGNPELKPSFSNRFRLRYRNFNSEKASTFMVMGNFNFVTNDIVNYIERFSDGRQETTFKNVNGNWDANARLIYNTPFQKWKKFSVNTMSYLSFSEKNGFVNTENNRLNSLIISERAGINYRSDQLDFGLRGNFTYSTSKNSFQKSNNNTFYNYGGTAETTIYLPFDFIVESDITYSTNSGYSDAFKENQWIWNASLAKQLFKAKNGVIRIKIYDILQQKSNISQTANNQYLQQSITNTINSYVIVHFVYKFQLFKGGMKASDMLPSRGGRPHAF